MKKLSILVCGIVLLSLTTVAQDQPFRIGVKIGWPNLAGLNAEYATPLLGGRLAPSVDFSIIPSRSVGDVEAKFSYFELGANVYVIKPGKGLYLNVGYGRFGFDGSVTQDVDFGGAVGVQSATGEVSLGLNRVNFKLGSKLGGRVYFRTEFGWGIGTWRQ